MVGGHLFVVRVQYQDFANFIDCNSIPNKMMDASSTDPYEQKLYQMFNSCDTNCCGKLDEKSLRQLCKLLELQDKGTTSLIQSLIDADGQQQLNLVTFERFKEALLTFLGTELDANVVTNCRKSTVSSRTWTRGEMKDSSNQIKDQVLVFNDTPDSSDREVVPKVVVGTKKYGRRSKPQTVVSPTDPLSPSDSDDNGDADSDEHRKCSTQYCANKPVQRSCSHVDIPTGHHRRRPPAATGGKVKRCSSLPSQKNGNLKSFTYKTTNKAQQEQLDDVFKLQNSSLESLGYEVESRRTMPDMWNLSSKDMEHDYFDYRPRRRSNEDVVTPMETLPMRSIVEMWEQANLPNGRGILLALGFDEDEIDLARLNKVIEEELRTLDDDAQLPLLKASLAIHSSELGALKQTFRQLQDENHKLRLDNKEANRRVSLLAVEIDERHASIEDNSQKELRLLEQKHAELVRELTTRMTNDRENWNNLSSRLEKKIKEFEREEIRMKTDVEQAERENGNMVDEMRKMRKQITELSERNSQLMGKMEEMERMSKATKTSFIEESKTSEGEDNELVRLMAKVSALQKDNTSLRDKNDELVAELENLNIELVRTKARVKKNLGQTATEESTVLEDADSGSASSLATKRRGDSPSKTRCPIEESPRLGKLRKRSNGDGSGNENSDTSGEWMALNSELQNSEVGTTTVAANKNHLVENQSQKEEIVELKRRVAELEEALQSSTAAKEQSPEVEGSAAASEAPLNTQETQSSGDERCQKLESSLKQLHRAYEECEDYWQTKLSEERLLFEKERQIYEEEQQESDKKFTELVEKVREYEEQFSKEDRLSPIEERDYLEQQYADLEAEAEQIRENASRIFEEKSKEIVALQNEVEDLRLRLGESVEILTGASELTAEAQRAAGNGTNFDAQSPASSPISYLWNQSTIQEPSKLSQSQNNGSTHVAMVQNSTAKQVIRASEESPTPDALSYATQSPSSSRLSPIQRPGSAARQSDGDVADCDTMSTASGKSFDTHSVASTHCIHPMARPEIVTTSTPTPTPTTKSSSIGTENACPSPGGIKEELKRLKFFEISLREQIKDLSLQRDGLVMELQQLQEAKPVLEKAYARSSHPNLIQRVNSLELKNRHLQNVIKQQHQYTESLVQQTWRQHQVELHELHGRIEGQGVMLTEQMQRLQNADILVKDLYVENSHLTATVQRLEQQQVRSNYMHQQQCQGLNGLSGLQMP